jgi:hypothetical protein
MISIAAASLCLAIEKLDINNIYSRTLQTRYNSPKTKIVLEFATLNKRKDFNLPGRDFSSTKINKSGNNSNVVVLIALSKWWMHSNRINAASSSSSLKIERFTQKSFRTFG